MKVHKKTYSKPLPNGAKILCRKNGKYCKYRNNKGVLQEAKLTKSGDKILCQTKLWHISFEDTSSIRRSIKGYIDKAATQRLADNIQKLLNKQPIDNDLRAFIEGLPSRVRADLTRFGLLDSLMVADKTLEDYIEGFRDHLIKKERTQRHIKEFEGIIKRVFKDCGFVMWMDIKPDVLKDYLDGLRDGGRGISKRRYNNMLGAVKCFCLWMVRQRKAASSPIDYLERLDKTETDLRHTRRVLSEDDFIRFLDTAKRGPTKYHLTGAERNFIYRLVIETGLRFIDLHRLKVQDFEFAERRLRIRAGETKNRKNTFAYLTPETTLELKQYCANKLPHTKVFCLGNKIVQAVRFDLAAAGIPYQDENGEFFDFHSLKHQAASFFAMNPETSESTRQELTHHQDPKMARHYTHVSEQQQRKAIAGLPDMRRASNEAGVKTGTDGKILLKSCFGSGQSQTPVDAAAQLKGKKVDLCRIKAVIEAGSNEESHPTHFGETSLSK